MEKINLGNSALSVGRLMVGCWSFGGEDGSYWGEQKQADVNALVTEALDRGINFFDTAVVYNAGKSETSLGIALGNRRNEAVICDKISIQNEEQLKNYESTLRECLKRLNTDYIDLMMIHWPVKDGELIKENLLALGRAQRQGMIREIGVSNFGPVTLEIARESGVNIVANEFGYNIISRGIEKEILPYCREHNIGILTYSPLMQGILTGKYRTISDIPPNRRRTVHFSKMGNPDSNHGGPGADAEVEAFLAGLRSLSEHTGISCGNLSLAWLCHQKGVSCVIAGCRTTEQLRENMASIGTGLSAETVKELSDLSLPVFEKTGNFLDLYRGAVNPRIW